jgi:hypothetical protein
VTTNENHTEKWYISKICVNHTPPRLVRRAPLHHTPQLSLTRRPQAPPSLPSLFPSTLYVFQPHSCTTYPCFYFTATCMAATQRARRCHSHSAAIAALCAWLQRGASRPPQLAPVPPHTCRRHHERGASAVLPLARLPAS